MRSPETLALLACVVVLVVLTARALLRTRAALGEVEGAVHRHRAWTVERRRFLDTRTAMAEAARTTTGAVSSTSRFTQTSHRAIASIPFGILEAIPVTNPMTRVVRRVHDDIADAVYAAIHGSSDGLGSAVHRRLAGEPIDPAGSVEFGATPEQP